MTYDEGSEKRESVSKTLDRFRQEVGTDYFDILLLHCMTKGDWAETRKFYMDGLAKAKQDGIVKAVGVSCHNWERWSRQSTIRGVTLSSPALIRSKAIWMGRSKP